MKANHRGKIGRLESLKSSSTILKGELGFQPLVFLNG